jgi:hypothetical protein
MIVDRSGMHLSPSFLVFAFPYMHDLPFQQTISKSALLRYSPTTYGELNYVAILLYPGIVLLVYEWINKRSKKHAVILWWIACYSIISGIAYYDNPNAARNIVGMPALIFTIALFMEFLVKGVSSFRVQIKSVHYLFRYTKSLVVIILSALVAVPTVLFLYEYYVVYPIQSAKVFDYGYKEVADFLSSNKYWGKDILVNNDPDRNITLSFYSPYQPPLSRITNIPYMAKQDTNGHITVSLLPIKDEPVDLTHLFIEIKKDISPFNQGTIEYETRIDKGYGGPVSSHISLFTPDGTSHLSLGLYHNDSLFGPNNYLLLQNGSSSKSQFEQRPLNQTIEYGKWYKVKLNINSTAISFYLNGRSITTWLRPADETYTNIHLAGESAAVSFKNMVIERKNNQFSNLFDDRNNNLLEWKIINSILGKSTFIKSEINVNDKYNEDHAIVKVDPETIIVTHSRENSHILTKYGTSAQLLKEIYSPDGTITLSVFRIMGHENIS